MLVDISIGHGYTSKGTFDPGAVNANGTKEHVLATKVVEAAFPALTRSGVTHIVCETNAGPSHDPDYVGSTRRVNSEGAGLALEVHFDSSNAPRGGFGIYAHAGSRAAYLAECIKNHWGQAGLPQRKSYADVRGLYFLQRTNCPSLIWECDRTDRYDPGTLISMGEAIAAGVCDYLQLAYQAPGKEPMPTQPVGNPPLNITMVDAIAASACGVPNSSGVYVLNLDGGIEAMHGAPFYGSYPGLPEAARQGDRGGGFTRIAPRAAGRVGYICLSRRDEPYEFGPGLNGFPG